MRIRWRLDAISDVAAIRGYIAEQNPKAAQAVTERILRSVDRLATFPDSGRLGKAEETREVVVPGLPYIVVYTKSDEEVEIVAVFHAARARQ